MQQFNDKQLERLLVGLERKYDKGGEFARVYYQDLKNIETLRKANKIDLQHAEDLAKEAKASYERSKGVYKAKNSPKVVRTPIGAVMRPTGFKTQNRGIPVHQGVSGLASSMISLFLLVVLGMVLF